MMEVEDRLFLLLWFVCSLSAAGVFVALAGHTILALAMGAPAIATEVGIVAWLWWDR